jgi:hypothetical protein
MVVLSSEKSFYNCLLFSSSLWIDRLTFHKCDKIYFLSIFDEEAK